MTNPEIIEKWRAEFESWFESITKPAGTYISTAVFCKDLYLEAWIAARESVVIELPEYSVDRLNRILDADEVEVAITNSGYAYDY